MHHRKIVFIILALTAAVLVMAGVLLHHPHEPAELPELSVQEYREDELVFTISLHEFIGRFNQLYHADYNRDYLSDESQWYSERYETGIHSPYETVCYDFTEDKTMWTLPTITAYVAEESGSLQEITVNFDDHSYQEAMYNLYEELCFYTLKSFLPDVDNETITWLYQMLNNYAYQNLLPHEQGYQYGAIPPVLYYQGCVGVYPYFAVGESMHLCIIPVNQTLLDGFRQAGVPVYNLAGQLQNPGGSTAVAPGQAISSDSRLPDDEKAQVETMCSRIAASTSGLYREAPWAPSAYMPEQNCLPQDTIDAMEDTLTEKGYAVLNTDAICPAWLENGAMAQFWQAVQADNDARQEYVWISPYGEFHYCVLKYQNHTPYFLEAICTWTDGGYHIEELYLQNVLDWTLTENGNFYYKLHDAHSPAFEDYTLLRLNRPDKALYQLTRTYLEPVGYQGNNLFSCSWDENQYQALCFNDLLEFLYREQNGKILDARTLPYQKQPFYYQVTAADFESAILPYFDITREHLRTLALYDSASGTYPWLDVAYDNLSYFPLITPEVKAFRKNTGGTITLTVDAMCIGLKTDSLFQHELTVRPHDDGSFQYVSNRLLSVSDEMPEYIPRLNQQR